jgi:hypothetical protein
MIPEIQDWVHHQLPWTMIGHFSASISSISRENRVGDIKLKIVYGTARACNGRQRKIAYTLITPFIAGLAISRL